MAATTGWLARFGRAVGSQAVDMISSRLNAPAQGGAKMTLGGQTVKLDADMERYLTKDAAGLGFASLAHNGVDTRGLARARTANRLTTKNDDSTDSYREMTMSRLLSGASFHLASAKGAAEAPGGSWSIWGRGAQSSFEGGGDAAIEGDVTTAMLGVDYEKGKLLGRRGALARQRRRRLRERGPQRARSDAHERASLSSLRGERATLVVGGAGHGPGRDDAR